MKKGRRTDERSPCASENVGRFYTTEMPIEHEYGKSLNLCNFAEMGTLLAKLMARSASSATHFGTDMETK